jgi:hypothetical protein
MKRINYISRNRETDVALPQPKKDFGKRCYNNNYTTNIKTNVLNKNIKNNNERSRGIHAELHLINANRLPCPRILSVITQVQGVTIILLK